MLDSSIKTARSKDKPVSEEKKQELEDYKTRFPDLTEENISEEIKRTKARLDRIGHALRDVVLRSYGASKGGDPFKEKELCGDDFKELNALQLVTAFTVKSSRSRVKGKQLIDNCRRVALEKPDAVCALAPAPAAYAKDCRNITRCELRAAYSVSILNLNSLDLHTFPPDVFYIYLTKLNG